MGKFDKSRLGQQKSATPPGIKTNTIATNHIGGDLRLKLLNKNQILDARQILNKKKHETQNRVQLTEATKKTILNQQQEEANVPAGSLLIMKTLDQDTGSERRLYKLVNNYNDFDSKKHIVFANEKNTLVTLNNDRINENRNQAAVAAPLQQQARMLTKTIKNYLSIDNNELDGDGEDDDVNNNNGYKIFQNREINMQIKRNFNNNENFKIKIDNRQKTVTDGDEGMDVDDEKVEVTQSPIQGYRLVVTNLHQNVTEDDLLELFSAVGPIKRAKLLSKGTADVVYVKLEDARRALVSYNNRLLDGRELKIELVTKIPISEKLAQPAVPAPVTTASNSYQFINYANKRLPVQQQVLPQRVQSSQAKATAVVASKPAVTTGLLSQRFANLNATPTTNEIEKLVPKVSQHATAHNSKVSVDQTVIHQALFTNTKLSSINPVTFTVKI